MAVTGPADCRIESRALSSTAGLFPGPAQIH
jgi:hypothetical protein